MKKILFFILILVFMVSSCNFLMKEEYGELVLSFDGSLPDGSRDLDDQGLPILASSRMEIKISGESGSLIIKSLKADEPKSLVELVPVGKKIEISVTAYNPSAQWSGKKTHTVSSGQNHVTVLLNKKASGLNKLLFTQEKIESSSHTEHRLNIDLNGKKIDLIQSQDPYFFARDSKGRVYIRYNSASPEIHRYTSEGKYDEKVDSQIHISRGCFFANDYTTGKMYVMKDQNLKEIKEDLSLKPVTSAGIDGIFAVDNDRIVQGSLDDGFNFSKIGSENSHDIEGENFKFLLHKFGLEDLTEQEFFICGDYLYILLSNLSVDTDDVFSLGALIKWKLGEKSVQSTSGHSEILPTLVGDPILIGKPAGRPVIENHVLKNYNYSKNFYNPVKVIGFDDENIYIADDGFDAAMTDAGPKIVKNRNRIATLNMNTNELTFTDAGPAKWYEEWNEWKGVNTKTIVWDDSRDYYQLEHPASVLPSTALATGMTDIFTYDQAGNLYIYYMTSFPSVSHKIKKFKLQADGSYDTNPEEIEVPNINTGRIDAIAVDLSTKSLYYIDSNNSWPRNYTIKRMKWTGNFGGAAFDNSYSITVSTNQRYISSLAANKDGVFVAVRTTTTAPPEVDKKYNIEVHKYSHDNAALLKTIHLVSEEPLYQAIQGTDTTNSKKSVDEAVEALHIKNGILYGLTTEITSLYPGGTSAPPFSYITGKLWQIGKDTGSFGEISAGENVKKLYGYDIENITSETTGDFAPTRFIAIKPKKLVIASTGYKCLQHAGNPEYKPKICEFDLETAAMDVVDKVPYILYKGFDSSEYHWD